MKRAFESLRPGRSYWALVGIVLFFFLPEIVAALWGEEIKRYFIHLAANEPDFLLRKVYIALESLGEVSWFNVIFGVVLVIWFFYERGKNPED